MNLRADAGASAEAKEQVHGCTTQVVLSLSRAAARRRERTHGVVLTQADVEAGDARAHRERGEAAAAKAAAVRGLEGFSLHANTHLHASGLLRATSGGGGEARMGNERSSWEQYFMDIARQVASRATCDRKHVGALRIHTLLVVTSQVGRTPG